MYIYIKDYIKLSRIPYYIRFNYYINELTDLNPWNTVQVVLSSYAIHNCLISVQLDIQMILVMNKIQDNMDRKMYPCGIFIDLKKAFDTVDHDTLLGKLDYYG